MLKRNISIILVVLLTLLLLALVIWMFDKKIESIEKKIQVPVTTESKQEATTLESFT